MTQELEQLRLSVRTVSARSGAATIAVAGECDLYEAHLLGAAIEQAAAAPGTTVHLDLSELSFLDSTGLHVLVEAQRSLEAAGSELVLVAPTDQIRRALSVSGLDGQFAVEKELDDPVLSDNDAGQFLTDALIEFAHLRWCDVVHALSRTL